ncbi:NUDIX hydrolase [Corynebacterium doosanense]|uniref:NUDIX hydrolase n=1 Tax=Corynebacterium doosanense CAU 212 = DSM 45436 TaxID=558173 RepID=A0A097IIZ0_9CORY|nr:NUDIX hydrolase [Corynebacterium doosanense]AIT62107.1 NUDIX hydrolase [Corynebacterium doosanense CAU 212 = DSM 45436]
MTDNDNASEARSGGSSEATGAQKGQRRRGRRRSRRRGQSPQQAQQGNSQQGQSVPQPEPAPKSGGEESGGESTNRPRQRRRRSSRGGKNRGNQANRPRNQQSQQNPQETATQPAAETAGAGAETRSSRGGQNRRTGTKGGNEYRRGQSSHRQRQGQGQGQVQHNRNTSANRHRGPDTSRMVTRDETSAGGLVMSGLAEAVGTNGDVDLSRIYVALIGRLDRRGRLLWSMPKGHVEPGEGHAATAEREVWEETGISGTVITELGVIDYWFVSDGVRIHKTVHHHLLRYADGDLNDEDPEVTEVAWIPASELIEHLAYADERKLARIAHDRLPDLARQEKAEGRATPR